MGARPRSTSMKNPWMSMWLSAFNSAAGQTRGFWSAEMQRQQTAMMQQMTRDFWRFWADAWKLPHSGR